MELALQLKVVALEKRVEELENKVKALSNGWVLSEQCAIPAEDAHIEPDETR